MITVAKCSNTSMSVRKNKLIIAAFIQILLFTIRLVLLYNLPDNILTMNMLKIQTP